jgi:hypothetical protein
MARLQCFSDDVRSPSAPTTWPDLSFLFFAFLNSSFTFNWLCQLVFVFSPHPNLFRRITELAWSISFSLSVTSSILSVLAKLWNPLINLISLSVSNADSGTSPSPMRRLVPACQIPHLQIPINGAASFFPVASLSPGCPCCCCRP